MAASFIPGRGSATKHLWTPRTNSTKLPPYAPPLQGVHQDRLPPVSYSADIFCDEAEVFCQGRYLTEGDLGNPPRTGGCAETSQFITFIENDTVLYAGRQTTLAKVAGVVRA